MSESVPKSAKRSRSGKSKERGQSSTEDATRPVAPSKAQGSTLGVGTRVFLTALAGIGIVVGSILFITNARQRAGRDQVAMADMQHLAETFVAGKRGLEERVLTTTRALAEQPVARALFVHEVDDESRAAWARDMRRTIESSSILLFDSNARLLARDGAGAGNVGDDFKQIAWVTGPLSTGTAVAATIREDFKPAIIAAAPVRLGEHEHVDGVLATSWLIDGERLLLMQSTARAAIGFVYDAEPTGPVPRPLLSVGTPDFPGEPLVSQLNVDPAFAQLLRRGGVFGPAKVQLGDDELIVVGAPMRSASGAMLGAFLMSRPSDAEGAGLRAMRHVLLIGALIAIAVIIPLSLLIGGGISGPLRELARAATAIRDGSLDVELPRGGTNEARLMSKALASLGIELRQRHELERMVTAQSKSTGGRGADPMQITERYDAYERLGQGGRGTVMRAYDKQRDEYVALKLFAAKSETDEVFAVFKRQLRTARKIKHANVVRFHDMGEWQNQTFVSMELLAGTTLAALLKGTGPISFGPGLQIAKQICRGLIVLHDSGIVHRELATRNIVVLASGTTKVMDFGFPRPLDAKTGSGMAVYMSPEQMGSDGVDQRSDIYSLGVVLYEMFTGAPPFQGSGFEALREQHASSTPAPPSQKRTDIPERLERLITMALSKRRSHRPATVKEVYSALQRVSVDLEEQA